MYNLKKIIRNSILVLSIAVFIMIFIVAFDDIDKIIEVFKTLNVKYFFIAILLILIYFLLWPLTLCMFTKIKKCDVSFKDVYLIGATEHFFNGITPFATGGQPFQAYALSKKNVKLADSTGILLMNFIVFMLVSNIFCLCSLFYYNQFTKEISNLNQIVIIGFVLNLTVFLGFFLILSVKQVKSVLLKVLLFLSKFKIFKKLLENRIDSFDKYFTDAQDAFKELKKNKGTLLICILIKAVTLFIYYSVTYFILKALNVNVGIHDLMYVILGTSFAITMVVWLPTPGASGGIELAFKSIFLTIAGVTSAIAVSGMLLWRIFTYYFVMIVSFICYLIFEKNNKEKVVNKHD